MATDFEILRASRTAGPLSSTAKLPALQHSPQNFEVYCHRSLSPSDSWGGRPCLDPNLKTRYKKMADFECEISRSLEFISLIYYSNRQ